MALLVLCGMTVCTAAPETDHRLVLQTTRHVPSDLEIGRSLQGAATNPNQFDAYVRRPKSTSSQSQMAASPQYDDATLSALRRYFASFQEPSR
jgi:hypothetical protein